MSSGIHCFISGLSSGQTRSDGCGLSVIQLRNYVSSYTAYTESLYCILYTNHNDRIPISVSVLTDGDVVARKIFLASINS